MELRKAYELVVKPVCVTLLVGVVASLLRIVIPRECRGGGLLDTSLLLVLASLCVSLHFLGTRRQNTVLLHGAIGLLAGLVSGFFLVRHPVASPWRKGAKAYDWQEDWMGLLIVTLIGSLLGIAVGTFRRAISGGSDQPAKWCDDKPIAKDLDEFRSRPSTWPSLFRLVVFGTALAVVFLIVRVDPFGVDPPVIDSRDVAEVLALGAEAEAGSPEPIRSSDHVWQPPSVAMLKKGNRFRDLRFSADGRALRTVDGDDAVCFWDVTNLALLRKVSIPAGYLVGSIRQSDGRYALCCHAHDSTRPVQFVDLDTGEAICEATLPFTWKVPGSRSLLPPASSVRWLADPEILLSTGWYPSSHTGVSENWWRLNYRTGEMIGDDNPRSFPPEGAHDELKPWMTSFTTDGEVTEDGKHLFVVGGGGKGLPPDMAGQIDLATFRTTDLGTIDDPSNGPFGLVPGGKYFHLGLHIYHRRTLNLVAVKDFSDGTAMVGAVTFSPDGSRYAAELLLRPFDEPRAVLVHETLTQRILSAFAPPSDVALLRFSQDGTKLAVAYADGVLELRTVPSGESARPVLP